MCFKGMPWLILCSIHGNDQSWRVKIVDGPHICLPASRNKKVSAKTVAAKFKDEILRMPFIRGRHIRALVKKRYGILIDLNKARRAKLRVMKAFQMQYIEEYEKLREYAAELVESNPNTSVHVEVERKDPNALGTFQQ